MTRLPVPLSERALASRPPEMGKIKLGEKYQAKNGKTSMRALDKFRFTTPFEEAARRVAEAFGGEARAFHDDKARPKDQFEVYTDRNRIRVWLQPGSLSIDYEMWGGKGTAERRCDGVTCRVPGWVGRDRVWNEVPCLCLRNKRLDCKTTTRMSLILPDVPFGGMWMLKTNSEYAADELRAMTTLIDTLSTAGLVDCDLLISKRRTMKEGPDGKPIVNEFVVPVLQIRVTPDQMLAGHASPVASLPASMAVAELPRAPDLPADFDDDDVADAELLDEEPTLAAAMALAKVYADTPAGRNLMATAQDVFDVMIHQMTKQADVAWETINVDEQRRLLKGLRMLAMGEIVLRDHNGTLRVEQAP